MSNGDIGFLVPNPDGKTLVAVTGEVPWSTKRAIKAYFDKKNVVAPIDPSAGGGFTKMAEQENLWEWMARGGPVMYVIFAVACLAALIMIERLIMLAAKSKASEQVMGRIKELAKAGKWKEAAHFCEIKKNVPTCQMLKGVLEHTGEVQEVLENALQESILKIMPSLERWLGTLALLAVISPLLGLLGTVTGMITVFNVITSVGTGDPKLMAGGISEALLTTQFGLILAIPIMLVHNLLERRVDGIVYDMQEKGTAFIVTMIKRQS
jgi:biopolymer transport protein ExbB